MEGGAPRRGMIRAAAGLALGVLVLLLVAAVLWTALAERGVDVLSLRPEDVEAVVRGWGRWGWAASVALMVLHSFLPLPAEIIPLANGMLFGVALGIALTWIGAMLGAVISFALARWLGRPFVRLIADDGSWERLERLPSEPGTLLFVRLVPLISFNLVNYAAGLLGVPWWRFLWTTAIGILPLTIIMVAMGDAMLKAPLWSWIAAAAVLLTSWLLWRRWRRRSGISHSG